MRSFRHVLVLILIATLGGASVPALAHPGSSTRPVKRVLADDFRFCRYAAGSCTSSDTNHRTHVIVGTRVKWIYYDNECDALAVCPGHNVKVGNHAASMTVKQDGALVFSMVFRSVGRFHYVCTHHANVGMTGRIVVTRH
jgi:hypothetical protein